MNAAAHRRRWARLDATLFIYDQFASKGRKGIVGSVVAVSRAPKSVAIVADKAPQSLTGTQPHLLVMAGKHVKTRQRSGLRMRPVQLR